MTKAPEHSPPTFEQALAELESIVDALEQDEMTLEQSLDAFERGIGLTRTCQQALETAEQRVRILTDARPDAEPEAFDTHD
ncbi:exodeoxyribonuclease VII small subunit [Marichromatium gracile]|uniref:Exodeoxyribonuclease 7 small subunit n=1 Tax=Marichromatium gracile TaxID=1048 RepID=A0A4R4A6U8_MARGR|nr:MULTISPECIES: exodeoxyribonuclease VII small subunit [Marichromatium]MBO8084832.1 exodeoxyribonuclease VII small subunit [Marichromatium sp.]KXX63800.1 exodeoxyribonuclease VII small subunit [Marichromatium gracile]MBK1709661.1 exodeoxyribonuclease VII small subunit [Marichromatium gracile]MCF1181832.1 exodeoxyribonuclease VII small subunit [Marichromatium gracile]RNE90964.1 exodeoxyribonuclease VII small subunit [Marichromatium sp. AB31]